MLRLYSSLSPGGRAQAGSLVKRHFGQFDPEGIYMVYYESGVKGVVGVGREDPAPWGGSWIMDLCAEEGRGIGTRLFRWAEEMGGEYLWTTSPSFFRPLGWRVHSLWEGRHIMVPGTESMGPVASFEPFVASEVVGGEFHS